MAFFISSNQTSSNGYLTFCLNRQRQDKQGRYLLRLRATINRRVSYASTGIKLLESEWDEARQVVVKRPNAVALNSLLRAMYLEKENAILAAHRDGQEVTTIPKRQTGDFYAFCKSQVARQSKRDKEGTTKHKVSDLKKLQDFREVLPFHRMNTDFLHAYEAHLIRIGNRANTVWRSMRFVRQMCRLAIEEGHLQAAQIKGYRWPVYEATAPPHLTLSELDLIEQFRNTAPATIQRVCDWFLFSCYTGLRYGDVRDFTPDRVVNGRILLRTEKSGEPVTLKLHPRLSAVLARMSRDVVTNQKFNEYLKIVAGGAGIDKRVTVHMARHTFAVTFL